MVQGTWQDWLSDRILRGVIWSATRLPIRTRLSLVSWIVRKLVAPLTKWHARVDANIEHVWPETPQAKRRAIADQAIDNLSRNFIEGYDVPELRARATHFGATGDGLAAIEQARTEGRPVLFLGAHFGSVECTRAALVDQGYTVGALYRPMSNPYFNEHFSNNYHALSEPAFAQGRKGTLGLMKHLKAGGMAVLLFDLYDSSGVPIDFLGKPAPTVTSAADIALRTGALLVPFFGIRHSDGYGFTPTFEAPIPHGDPVEMMQEATRRLEARIEENPGQWMWMHRRWKPKRQAKRQRKRAAAEMAP
jgi:KDO2-lipid IV(A) lauroyltransferase